MVDTGASNQDVMNHREGAFAAYPLAMYITDASVMQGGSLVHEDATPVDIAGERDLFRVEVVEA